MQRYTTAGLVGLAKGLPARPKRSPYDILPAAKQGNHMDRTLVWSSNIRSVGYEDASRTLEIEFLNGRLYQYSGVPEAIYQSLMRAASKGAYFNTYIKDRYPERKVR
jgi:KTSC domain